MNRRPAIDLRPILGKRRAAELTVEPLVDALAEFAGSVSDAIGKDYNLLNPRAEKHLREYASKRVDMINGTTRKALIKALDGDDPEAAVRHVFQVARDSRARNIAVSEVVRTSNWAAIDAGKWVGALDLKTWVSQRDAAVRATHADLDGQTVGWLEDFVSSSGARGPHPGHLGDDPSENAGCRCFAAPSRPGARNALTGGESLQEFADELRAPFVDQLEAAWRKVFDEQEAAVLAELG